MSIPTAIFDRIMTAIKPREPQASCESRLNDLSDVEREMTTTVRFTDCHGVWEGEVSGTLHLVYPKEGN